LEPIQQRVLAFIDHPDAQDFDHLALEVFQQQFEKIEPYRLYCLGCGVTPATVPTVDSIPRVSSIAFKHVKLCIGVPERIFVTSGTSQGRNERGAHCVANLALYRASALSQLRAMMFPDSIQMRMLALHPTSQRMPESSLSQMISWTIEEFGDGNSLCAADRDGIDTSGALDFLSAAERAGQPVSILTTTAAFSRLIERVRTDSLRYRLAPGSRLMDTGGPKGQAVAMTPEQVIEAARRFFAIEPDLAINEYGMTELCSQLYDATRFNSKYDLPADARIKIAPPWMRVRAVDPITLQLVEDGQIGLLAYFDLANASSISAVLTEDLGLVANGCVKLLGRAEAADSRGCALAMDQFVRAQTGPARGERIGPSHRLRSVDSSTAAASSVGDEAPELAATAADLRAALSVNLDRERIIRALIETILRLKRRDHRRRRKVIEMICRGSAFSPQVIDASIDALLAPFNEESIRTIASRLRVTSEMIGFIMAGNAVGAGMHEVLLALICGAAVIIKSSSAEPFFFRALAETLAEVDARVATRIAVVTWNRENSDLSSRLLELCDRMVVYGDDSTLEAFASNRLIGFGSKASGALIAAEALCDSEIKTTASALAHDIMLFEQKGCLSPSHLFVVGSVQASDRLSASLSFELEKMGVRDFPPARLELEAAAKIRRVRETATWRKIAGVSIDLFEGARLQWTIVGEPDARFMISPGYRTVFLSAVKGTTDFRNRLTGFENRIEAFSVADPKSKLADFVSQLRSIGVTWICPPGSLQSPPISWNHGNGAFLTARLISDGAQ
jgi:hypothetical protein